MATSRSASYNCDEDRHLCRVYIDISQDPLIGTNQSKDHLWSRIADNYNSSKPNIALVDRNQRSLQCRMGLILHAVSKLNGCIRQVEYDNPSGASEQDIMDRAKQLLMLEPKYSKGFKYDHVWPLMKDFVKFDTTTQKCTNNLPSSQSDTSVPESPVSFSPGVSSFNLNLSDENEGGPSSQRPEGVKKSKLKRKIGEDFSAAVETIKQQNHKILDLINEANLKQQQAVDISERKRDDKILMINLDSIPDSVRREYFRNEQNQILQKRTQQSGSHNPSNIFGQYFHDFGGSGSDLPDY